MNMIKMEEARKHLHNAVDAFFDAMTCEESLPERDERVLPVNTKDPSENPVMSAPAEVQSEVSDPESEESAEPQTEEPSDAPTEDAVPAVDLNTLRSMPYNEFKKYAASIGVNCTGTRAMIEGRVMEKLGLSDTPALAETKEEPAPVKKEPVKTDAPRRTLRRSVNTAPVQQKPEDEFDKMARAYVQHFGVEDTVTELKDSDFEGVTASNVTEKLADLLRSGDLSLTYADMVACELIPNYGEISAHYDPRFDLMETGDPAKMTEARRETCIANIQTYMEAYNAGPEAFNAFIEEQYDDLFKEGETRDLMTLLTIIASDEELEELSGSENTGEKEFTEDDALNLFIEIMKRTVDDDGEEHELSDTEGLPYTIGNDLLHCAHLLILNGDHYTCPICNGEFANAD